MNEYRSEEYYDELTFKHSLIRSNDIIVFTYIDLYKPYMRKAENIEELDKTKVIVDQYKIENQGGFEISQSDTVLLKTKISNFEDMGELEDSDPLKGFLKLSE